MKQSEFLVGLILHGMGFKTHAKNHISCKGRLMKGVMDDLLLSLQLHRPHQQGPENSEPF